MSSLHSNIKKDPYQDESVSLSTYPQMCTTLYFRDILALQKQRSPYHPSIDQITF